MIRLGVTGAVIIVVIVTLFAAGRGPGAVSGASSDGCTVASVCHGAHAVAAVCGSACGHGFHVAVSDGVVIVVAVGSSMVAVAASLGRAGRLVPAVLDRPPRLSV